MDKQGQIKIVDLIRNTLFHSSGVLLGRILGVFSKIVSLKILGLEILGIYALLNLVIPYYSYFFLGTNYSLPKKIPELQSSKNNSEIDKTRSSVNLFSLIISISLIIAFFIYIIFFYDPQDSIFSIMNLSIVFLTAIVSQALTLVNSHFKSIGSFTKIHKNAAIVRVLSPALSIILVYLLGLNGLLLSALIINLGSLINIIHFANKKKANLFHINHASKDNFIQNTKLGISMLFSKKLSDILYTILITSIGINFSSGIVGGFTFLATMFGMINQILGAFYTIVERRIYLGIELGKSKIEQLINLSFGNSMIFGTLIYFLVLIVLSIIPIYFPELIDNIPIIPFIVLLFVINSEIMITDYYVNAYNLFKIRNIIAVLILIIYYILIQFFIEDNLEIFIIIYCISIKTYKILISLFLKKFYSKKAIFYKLFIGDIVMNLIVFLFPFLIIEYQIDIYYSLLLFIPFYSILLLVYFEYPTKLFKDLKYFLNQDLNL